MSWRRAGTLAALVSVAACRQSAADRATEVAERARSLEAVRESDVVVALRTPPEPGRLIYDAPSDLSYTSILLTRPDLLPKDSSNRK